MEEKIKRGEVICTDTAAGVENCPKEPEPTKVSRILVEDRWTSSHDDAATFIELLDEENKVLRRYKFDIIMGQYPLEDVEALIAYLEHKYCCPVIKNLFS